MSGRTWPQQTALSRSARPSSGSWRF